MDLLERYLSDEDPGETGNVRNKPENTKKEMNVGEKKSKLPTRKEEISINSITNKIKIECKNFLVSEYKLIVLFSLFLCLVFCFFGKNKIRWFFIMAYILGTLLSFICGYISTVIAVLNCQEILSKSK
jgi:Na+/H+-translocating membrane pyrophosphatase